MYMLFSFHLQICRSVQHLRLITDSFQFTSRSTSKSILETLVLCQLSAVQSLYLSSCKDGLNILFCYCQCLNRYRIYASDASIDNRSNAERTYARYVAHKQGWLHYSTKNFRLILRVPTIAGIVGGNEYART